MSDDQPTISFHPFSRSVLLLEKLPVGKKRFSFPQYLFLIYSTFFGQVLTL